MSIFSFVASIFSPSVNVDGTPMIDDTGIDILGNPFGVTDTSSDMFDSSSPFDSFGNFDN